VVEDVKFDHAHSKYGKFYSLCEIGKTKLYKWLEDKFKIQLVDSSLTYLLRREIFGEELKSKKLQKSFYSHCIDSYSIIKGYYACSVNTKVRYITKIWMSKRELYREKNKIKDSCRYFKYKKGGENVFFDKFSKVKKLRTKVTEEKSNHGPWTYALTEAAQCFKKFKTRYGGTIKNGNSRSDAPEGKSKYAKFKNNILVGYQHRNVEVFYA